MDAYLKLRVNELDNSVVEKIKSLFADKQDAFLIITVGDSASEYWETLNRSKNDLENGRNLITFTIEELEEYASSKKP